MNITKDIFPIIQKAGKAIMEVYKSDFDIEVKDDNSPLTKADKDSHKIITKSLKKLYPSIPIISEEASLISTDERFKWKKYFLIDPLDGTKEFIKKNGEFTVNIALIENNKPIMGIIHAPSENVTYWGSNLTGAKIFKDGQTINISTSHKRERNLKILVSRSHQSESLRRGLKRINKYYDIEILEIGSSLKFCLLASGEVDLYPRFSPTSEWDIAAGQAIIESAGGYMSDFDKKPIEYNCRENYIVSNFIVGYNKAITTDIMKILDC